VKKREDRGVDSEVVVCEVSLTRALPLSHLQYGLHRLHYGQGQGRTKAIVDTARSGHDDICNRIGPDQIMHLKIQRNTVTCISIKTFTVVRR
jgi:hypothetical protein